MLINKFVVSFFIAGIKFEFTHHMIKIILYVCHILHKTFFMNLGSADTSKIN